MHVVVSPSPRSSNRFLTSTTLGVTAALFATLAPSAPAQVLRRLPKAAPVAAAPPTNRPATPAPGPRQNEPIQVMVELQDPPASRVVARARQAAQGAAEAEAAGEAHVARLRTVQAGLMPQLTAPDVGATVLFQAQRSYNGIAVSVDPNQAAKMFAMPGVKDVHPLIPKTRTAANSINFLGTPSFWNAAASGGLNLHGENIKVAVMDSGIDYLHTDFGGPGTGYGTLNSTAVPGNGIYPNARVKAATTSPATPTTATTRPSPTRTPSTATPTRTRAFPPTRAPSATAPSRRGSPAAAA